MPRETAPRESPHRRYPVADVAGYLVGRWSLERTVCDRRAGVEGRFRGSAVFRARTGSEGQRNTLVHEEEGELTWNGETHPASRTLYLRPQADGSAEVTFADGRPFHTLDLRTGAWTAVHLCAADRYEGDFTVCSPDEWHQQWRVRGPAKDQLLRSVYRRRPD